MFTKVKSARIHGECLDTTGLKTGTYLVADVKCQATPLSKGKSGEEPEGDVLILRPNRTYRLTPESPLTYSKEMLDVLFQAPSRELLEKAHVRYCPIILPNEDPMAIVVPRISFALEDLDKQLLIWAMPR